MASVVHQSRVSNALFTQIRRVPLDLNNEDEGEKLMGLKVGSLKHEHVARFAKASNQHVV